jgi:hypothetical protein
VLHGIILDGEKSRAYLEDPSTKRVLAYKVGDSVAGGELKAIGADRVSIERRDGQMYVMLKDPAKPAAVAQGDAAQRAGQRPGAAQPPARAQRGANPLAPLFTPPQPQPPGAAPAAPQQNQPVEQPPAEE